MSVLLLADAKAYLGIPAATATHDAELQEFIDAAEAAIGDRVGPLAPEARTARVVAVGGTLMLPAAPVSTLTSVTPVDGSTSLVLDDLYLDVPAGLVTGVLPGEYTVSFIAGRSTVPASLLLATKELLRHLWRTQRGPGGSSDAPSPGMSFAMPNRVLELIGPHLSVGF